MRCGACHWVVVLLLAATTARAQTSAPSSTSSERLEKALPPFTGDWDEI